MRQTTDPILTIAEVAKELRCSKAHIYAVISGRVTGVSSLPVIRLGRRKLVRRSSLERWKAANDRPACYPMRRDGPCSDA